MKYSEMTKEALLHEKDELQKQYKEICDRHLTLDMSRGKPGAEQLEISQEMLGVISTPADCMSEGGFDCRNYGMMEGILRLPGYWRAEKIARDRAMEYLTMFHLEDNADDLAGSLPYGAQRRLEIARALATNPSLLLLDEPAAGMNPSETAELMENIVRVRDTFQIAVLLIEHDMNLVMNICEGIAVLSFGRIIAKGSPDDIRSNPAVIEAYLGRKGAQKT